jgi:hypothetical protein
MGICARLPPGNETYKYALWARSKYNVPVYRIYLLWWGRKRNVNVQHANRAVYMSIKTNLRYQYFKQWKLNEQTLKKEWRQCSNATNVDELSSNGGRARIEHVTGKESQDARTAGDCINEEAHTTGNAWRRRVVNGNKNKMGPQTTFADWIE